MKKIITLLVLVLTFTSCQQQEESKLTYPQDKVISSTNKTPVTVHSTLQDGVILGINSVVTTEDSSNDRAVNGALLGGAASYFLSSKPSITKTLIGAGSGAVIGKTTGGTVTQTTHYILTIKNLSDNSIEQKATQSLGFKVKDTITYDIYKDIIFKKITCIMKEQHYLDKMEEDGWFDNHVVAS